MSDDSSTPLKPTTFALEVEGIGAFTFKRRRLRDGLAIQREYSDIMGACLTPIDGFVAAANWVATLRVLTVSAPDGWDLEAMDPDDDGDVKKMAAVYGALRAREDTFRGRAKPGGEAGGEAAG